MVTAPSASSPVSSVPSASTSGPHSYTSPSQSLGRTLSELAGLWRGSRVMAKRVPEEVLLLIETAEMTGRYWTKATGRPFENLDIVEIGAGQTLGIARVFAAKNRVTATDLDVYAEGWNPLEYWRMFRRNGPKRVIKTLGRKALGMDRVFMRELRKQLRNQLGEGRGGTRRLPHPAARQMDATKMEFPDNSVDFVYSFNVFEHLEDPRAVLREARRIVRPGGCVFTHLHLYTSDSGCHDLRIIRHEHEGVPYWPHLRPRHEHEVQNSAYLNKLTMAQWRQIFDEEMASYITGFETDEELRPEMERLRAGGELAGYSDEELLTKNLITIWKKPG